jgi:hypothetical protein
MDPLLLIAVLVGAVGMGLIVGVVGTAWDFKRLGRTRARISSGGQADWKPFVCTDPVSTSVEVWITKNYPKQRWIQIGRVRLDAANYQQKYDELIDMAQDRAVHINLEQNTYNYG